MTTDKRQIEKFKQAARDAECDTDEIRFEGALKEIAASKKKTQRNSKTKR